MGLATIDLHSQKEHTEIHKILKFDVNHASFEWPVFTEIQLHGLKTGNGFRSSVSKSEHLKCISKAREYHVVCSLFANTILNRLGFGMFTMVTAIFHCL